MRRNTGLTLWSLGWLGLVLGCTLATGVALARTPREEASERFQQGNAAYSKGEYQTALELFRQAKSWYPSPKIDLNIASTLASLGRYTEAAERYETFLRTAARVPPAILTRTRASLERLRNRLSRLKVVCPVTGATITVGGESIGQTPMVRWRYFEPGTRRIEICKRGFHCRRSTLNMRAGEKKLLSVRLSPAVTGGASIAAPSAAPSPARRAAAAAPPDDDSSSWKPTAGWVSLGVGSAALATGVVFAGLVSAKSSEHRQAVTDGKTFEELEAIAASGRRYQRLQLGTLIAGGVAAAAGAALLLWHWLGVRQGRRVGGVYLAPFCADNAHGVLGGARF